MSADDQREQRAADRSGWHEFYKPGVMTTHIAYVHENGWVYLPEPQETVALDDFHLASAEGHVHRLVHEDDLIAAARERDQLRATVERVRALFAGGPDTPCRTTWPDGVECVEVPMSDLRAALDGQP